MVTFGNSGNSKKLTKYACETCDFNTSSKNDFNRHLKTIKHLGNAEEIKKLEKNSCEICDFTTSSKNDFNLHLKTIKHLGNEEAKKLEKNSKKTCDLATSSNNDNTEAKKLKCNTCEKMYVSQSGLWKHKQKCTTNSVVQEKDELILTLLKQNTEQNKMNAELHAKVIELCKNGIINNTTNNNNSNNTTSNNSKTFNLQIFLNETCKDAVNLEDFAKAVVLQLSDLDKIGEIGFVDGMTNIIETRLKSLDVNKRPIHCTDAKREVFYVKDNDKWGKDKGNEKMRRLILRMDRKLAPLLIAFNQNHKNKGYSTDYEDIKHQKKMCEILGKADDADAIIRRISKKILIEKVP